MRPVALIPGVLGGWGVERSRKMVEAYLSRGRGRAAREACVIQLLRTVGSQSEKHEMAALDCDSAMANRAVSRLQDREPCCSCIARS